MPRLHHAGLSFIEILVYVGLLAMTGVVLTRFATQVIERNSHVQLTAQVLDNARGAMAALTQEIRHSSGVYTPTSSFDTHPGQLSLASRHNLPADENETYVDFYLDDERLYVKREGEPAALFTSENVRVSNLTFVYLNQTSDAPAVQVNLTVVPSGASQEAQAQAAVTLSSTASLRSY